MWSFYLNDGATAVVKNLCRDGFQCGLPDGSLVTWHTTKKEDGYLEGHFLLPDGIIKSRQAMYWHKEEVDKVSYYSSADSENPYLTYSCRRVNRDVVNVTREWADKKVNYPVIAISRNEEGRVTHYRCLMPEETCEVVLTYDAAGQLICENVSVSEENGTFIYSYDERGILLLQQLIKET